VIVVDGYHLETMTLPGAPPTLVFLHEGLGCVELWRDFPERACRAAGGRAGLVYSRLGYGSSDPRPLPWPMDYMEEESRLVPRELA
jgi:pimeloyl-ACP methyl ester carboxylesterase